MLSVEDKVVLISRMAEEVLEPRELHAAFLRQDSEGKGLTCYDGFEPSGRIHIAQGLLKAINVNRLLRCGIRCLFYIADWFALLNNKCGGDLEKIRRLGQYFVEVWKASGMRGIDAPDACCAPDAHAAVKFVWASEFIRDNSQQYWLRVLDVSRSFNVPRLQRCSTIMGRDAGDGQPIAQIIYPCMQAADVIELGLDFVEMGVDQRKVNMLARDYCDKLPERKGRKPVIVMHHMLLGLVGGKMSKSVAGSAIYMDDDRTDIEARIMTADCPPCTHRAAEGEAVEGVLEVGANPILEYYRYIVFGAAEVGILSERLEDRRFDCGVDIPFAGRNAAASVSVHTYACFEDLATDYAKEALTAEELKRSLVEYVDALLAPVRAHFTRTPELQELLEFVKHVRLTR